MTLIGKQMPPCDFTTCHLSYFVKISPQFDNKIICWNETPCLIPKCDCSYDRYEKGDFSTVLCVL